jgi:hypothetical protein
MPKDKRRSKLTRRTNLMKRKKPYVTSKKSRNNESIAGEGSRSRQFQRIISQESRPKGKPAIARREYGKEKE